MGSEWDQPQCREPPAAAPERFRRRRHSRARASAQTCITANANRCLAVLNIGKLGRSGADYYLDRVASGVEDYYVGAGEAHGYWLGRGSAELSLAGTVEPSQFRAVLAALNPATDQPLGRATCPRTVPGFDLTFRAPKSVSLLYGLSSPAVSGQVWEAHDEAVAAAVDYLERAAGFTRRGLNGRERLAVSGFVAAAFRHRTSRAGDPLLHTHVVVANLVRTADDGAWRTLDARGLYVHAKTAGYLYQAHLRDELTRRLGVEWEPVRNGCADLAGVPTTVIEAFSQRRAEILTHLLARGESSARAAQIVTLATRRAKVRDVQPESLTQRWRERAAALGFDADRVASLVGRQAARDLDARQAAQLVELVTGPEGLTQYTSTFAHRDVLRALCQALPAGAPVGQVEALAANVLGHDEVVLLAPTARAHHASLRRRDGEILLLADEARYSTNSLLAAERGALALTLRPQTTDRAVASAETLDAVLAARPTLSAEQRRMVSRLTTSGASVEVVVGKAGAGKTYALDAAREAWQREGVRVIGCALAARAAQSLYEGAGIPSTTIHALLARFDKTGEGLPRGAVLVVDEAGMVGTRHLARLLDFADRAGGKVVLVGDPYQLPEIQAGGLFGALAERLPVIHLEENRRQVHGWERRALDELRHGDVATAMAAYTAAGRVVTDPDPDTLRERLVADWWTAVAAGDVELEQAVMLAARRSDVDDLNARARARMAAAGRLTGLALQAAGGRQFQVGDAVVALRNDRRLGLLNGTRGRVFAVDANRRAVTIAPETGARAVTVPARYLDAGHLDHAYAITGHKAQGQTVDRAWVLATPETSREWGYVAMSRARLSTRLYVLETDSGAATDVGRMLSMQPWRRARAQALAIDLR